MTVCVSFTPKVSPTTTEGLSGCMFMYHQESWVALDGADGSPCSCSHSYGRQLRINDITPGCVLARACPDGDRAVWRKWAAASWNALQCKMLTKAINLVQFLGKEQKKNNNEQPKNKEKDRIKENTEMEMHGTALSESKKEPEASRVTKDVKKEKEPEVSQVTKLTALPESKKEPEYSQVTCVLTKKKPGKSLKKGSCPRCVRWLTMLWLCCCFLPTAVATRSSPSCALMRLNLALRAPRSAGADGLPWTAAVLSWQLLRTLALGCFCSSTFTCAQQISMGLGMRIGTIRIELCLIGCLSLLMIATCTSKFGPNFGSVLCPFVCCLENASKRNESDPGNPD